MLSFVGAGVYAISYLGGLELYAPVTARPLYVGKAVPRGGRIGGFDLGADAGPVLFNRIREHARSLEQVGSRSPTSAAATSSSRTSGCRWPST